MPLKSSFFSIINQNHVWWRDCNLSGTVTCTNPEHSQTALSGTSMEGKELGALDGIDDPDGELDGNEEPDGLPLGVADGKDDPDGSVDGMELGTLVGKDDPEGLELGVLEGRTDPAGLELGKEEPEEADPLPYRQF